MRTTAELLRMRDEQRKQLEAWLSAGITPQWVVFRSRICLLAVEGNSNMDIAKQMQTSRPTFLLRMKRFQQLGPEGLTKDATKDPRSRRLRSNPIRAIVEATLTTTPDNAIHWSTRAMEEKTGE